MQSFIHYFFHLVFPAFVALYFFKSDWKRVYFIFLLTMLVDLDHLLADPVFVANRCSVGYHYLHSIVAIFIYVLMLFSKSVLRIIAIGLLMHMGTDLLDCLMSFASCGVCIGEGLIPECIASIWSLFNLQ